MNSWKGKITPTKKVGYDMPQPKNPHEQPFPSSVSANAVHTGGDESLAQRVIPANSLKDIIKKRKASSERARLGPIEYMVKEVVIDRNGSPRQAGADIQDGNFIDRLRKTSERSLYFFSKGILNRHFLTIKLHKPVCEFIQVVPPFRKLVLMPREHGKTAIISGALPLHIIIQPAVDNVYFPGLDGSECRILLAGETQPMAEKNLRVLEDVHTSNVLFRALWPHKVWENPKREAKSWNQKELIFPRKNEWPDPTIWAKGVGGAVTGSRPNVIIKDDLISLEARDSETVMGSAIFWHKVSRALLDTYEKESGLQALEFIIGTRWAIYDLYSEIIDNDPTVEVIDSRFHKIINNGEILWPEKHTVESINALRESYKAEFFLLYMNDATDSALTDFSLEDVREFKFVKDNILFERTKIDDALEFLADEESVLPPEDARNVNRDIRRLTPGRFDALMKRHEYIRLRAR